MMKTIDSKLLNTYSIEELQQLVRTLLQETERLNDENKYLNLLLETSSEHADEIQNNLLSDKEDLEMMIEFSAEHADQIAAELEQKRQEIRNTFGRYVSNEIVSAILDNDDGLELGGQRKEITILTSDLRAFTNLSESLAPEDVVKILNYYLAAMELTISKHMGIIDEFMGDGILVLFGTPVSQKNDALNAVICAIEMQLAMKGVNNQMVKWGLPQLEMGIGIHSGDVIVGNIGSENRTKYGIVGANVNLTYRIESYTVGGQILISEQTYNKVKNDVEIFDSMQVSPKGVANEITVYSIKSIPSISHLCLTEVKTKLPKLSQAIDIEYALLEGKNICNTTSTGSITHQSDTHAFIEISSIESIPATLSNILLRLHEDQIIYAKVINFSQHQIKQNGFFVCFTAK